jgi:hypothetical protein
MKRCKHCGAVKNIADFYADSAARDGHRPECKACTASRRKRWYLANREREIARVKAWQQANAGRVNDVQRRRRERPEVKAQQRDAHLRRKFQMTSEQYGEMLAAQGGVCAVCCGGPKLGKSLHVDHNHDTGAVRGLVCFSCNSALGNLHEDEARISALLTYLITHDPEQQHLAAITRQRLAALSA